MSSVDVSQSDELIGALEEASRRAQEPADYSRSSGGGERRAGAVSEGARLLATQMAVAGSSRETIASRLTEEFDIDDPSAILPQVGI